MDSADASEAEAGVTGLGLDSGPGYGDPPSEGKRPLYGTTQEHCEQMIARSLEKNPMVKFMREALEKSGCPTGKKFFKAEVCSQEAGGGFRPEDGVSGKITYK
ncbi:hypothetical protein CBR_g12098 [Chara braunii]|uniref:Mitochondrial inner membrane protease ATP23 n=1 Tax=Chara braunii TaxID=69332 RepID=A0A388KR65_CHABU|nr:hypothetical protein CBR_g12098 [Chara braunii]|eukprot:GBG72527.1 hypothetical protein CBR_g12098 [Chara braunii]